VIREVLRTAALVAAVLLAVLGAALLVDRSAAYGAAVGAAVVLGVLGGGSMAVSVVARVLPGASLLFALLTYTLQVVLLLVVFASLDDAGLLDSRIDREWLSGTVVAGTLAWIFVQILVATRARIPAYDALPEPPEGEPKGE
jgi:ATP synthase protein I